ncbi:MAG: NAD(P)/FAD-dependent oxidoreductase [Planctomycetaceae bacterium]|nr:NAD(P)/FAD-dependent oxidoreductase [Planctomycetales bacterium]MCB9937139.1 NAD(P)/FAD-dependent oxidoreductase [Planctomycetaceae bacterium]
MDKYDVVVVGAGLAGLSCARWLSERGQRVMLVDRKSSVDQSVHTTGIFVRRTLEDFTLPEHCLGPVVRNVRLYSPRRRMLALSSPHDEFRVGRMGVLYQHLLRAGLAAGVLFAPATSFRDATVTSDGMHLELESQSKRDYVHTKYLIGADGANSRVARALSLSQNREWIVGVEEVYDSRAMDAPPCLHCFLDPELAPGYIAWIAHDGAEMHVGVGGYGNRFDPNESLTRFLKEVPQFVPAQGLPMLERRGGRIPVGGLLPRIVSERGLLVGDAAGAVSPMTAGGLDPCLRQSSLAVDVIVKFLREGDAAALDRYESAPFRKRFRTRSLMRRSLATIQSPWVAEMGFAFLRLAPFTSLARHVFFGRGSFPTSDRELQACPGFRPI